MREKVKRIVILLMVTLFLIPLIPVKKVQAAPVYQGDHTTNVWYKAHVQDIGWQLDTTNGSTAGTVGQVKQMEAIEIDVSDAAPFWIEYTSLSQGESNWRGPFKNGQTAGTVGENRGMVNLCVAIKDKATGKDSTSYDVWYRVHVRDYGWRNWVKDGYIPNSDISKVIEAVQIQIRPKGQGPIENNSALLQQKIINEARRHLGKPYVWGATGPSSFDCSGFTQYVYKQALGIDITRTTYTQINSGREVSRSELQPGDLVFPSSGHVQIYTGNGKVIHSPKPGDVVKEVPMYGFWRARRIIN